MKPIPAVPSRYFSIPPTAKSTSSRLDIDVERSDRLVAVEQHHGALGACDAHDLRDIQLRAVAKADVRDRHELGVLIDRALAKFSAGM